MDQLGVRRPVTRIGLLVEIPAHGPAEGGVFERLARLAQTAEDAGFDSLWVNDREADEGVGGDEGDGLEAYTLLGALATRTRTIRLGALPRGMDTRSPSVLAKIVTGVDVISHGRSVAALGAGSGAAELGGSGDKDHGIGRLTEGLRVCRAVLDEEGIEFSGTFHHIHGALNRPRPLQVGGIPLALFVDDAHPLRPELLAVAAGYADAVMVVGDEQAVAEAAGMVHDAVRLRDRPPGSVQVVWVMGSPSTVSVANSYASPFGDSWPAGVDGCILSISLDASLELIREAALQCSGMTEARSERRFPTGS